MGQKMVKTTQTREIVGPLGRAGRITQLSELCDFAFMTSISGGESRIMKVGDNVSAPSSFIANSHNELRFMPEKATY